MQKPLRNYAFVDSQNVNLQVQALGWRLDFQRFRVYLREKYGVERAYLFLAKVPGREGMYRKLESFGYQLVHKPAVPLPDGSMKGNCDAELVLQAMADIQEYGRALLVSGDGDFACLVRYLKERGKLAGILAPSVRSTSGLLKGDFSEDLQFMDYLRDALSLR